MPPTIPTDAGTIAVPMSSILDALEGVLTEAERKQLFGQMIGLRPAGVAPGDLITADLFNGLLRDVNELMQRVATLEAGTDTMAKKPVIRDIQPKIVRTGQEMTVFGENLTPKLLSRIDVEDTSIPLDRIKAGSGPGQLIIDAPVVMDLPANGGPVILSVSNPAGTAEGTYFQLPALSSHLQAKVAFKVKSITPQEDFKANTPYDFTFDIEIHSSHDETFVIVPQIEGQGFSAKLKDSDKVEVTSASASAGFRTSRTITVTTGASGTGTLTLTAKGTKFPSFAQTSQPTKATVAAAPEIPTQNITFNGAATVGPNSTWKNNTLFIKRKPSSFGNFGLALQFIFGRAESFQVSGLTFPAQGWKVVRGGSQDPIPSGGPGGLGTVNLLFTPLNDGTQITAPDGQFSFALTSSDGKDKLTVTGGLKIVDTLP